MLRIIAGQYKGRKLKVPSGATRPTADRVREAVMSIIGPKVLGARVLDPTAGSGALGLEALSRGASWVVLGDRSAQAAKVILENLALINDPKIIFKKTVLLKDFDKLLALGPFDLIFLDPPYKEISWPREFLSRAAKEDLAAPEALAVWEQEPETLKTWTQEDLKPWQLVTARTWGQRAAAFFFLNQEK
ncbi:MAG: 16S rRNA (guanine(966)-N(2))-methyltransferase RsmD [Deltaproteobacteria bacterium]|nr:16S rRNA (guanine(966)-N(2))-methyltransferase RsmD [Deltaproteobacteria bacterium]